MAQTTSNNSGMGIMLGIIMAAAVIVGAYFLLRTDDTSKLQPAAGTEALVTTDPATPADSADRSNSATPPGSSQPAR